MMKIIDAHMHFSNITRFVNMAKSISLVNYSEEGLKREFEQSDIIMGIGMGVNESKRKSFPDEKVQNPMNLDLESKTPETLRYCAGINPFCLTGESIRGLEKDIELPAVVGLKIYPGYYPVYVYDKIYEPVYKLAEKYDLPVVIHTGDTFSYRGYLEFSHPLTVNRLAAEYKKVNFIIAHFGNPWVMDTAVVISNNTNVFADLSGLIVGSQQRVEELMGERLFIDNIRRGLIYDKIYHKVMFGSDWPLVPIAPYIEFIKLLIPEENYEDVFFNNAQRVFSKIR